MNATKRRKRGADRRHEFPVERRFNGRWIYLDTKTSKREARSFIAEQKAIEGGTFRICLPLGGYLEL